MTDKRSKLEQIATDFVQKSGLHNLSFRTLASEVGVKSSSVHYHFPEKSHLATALIQNYSNEFIAQLEKIDGRNLTLKKKLDAFVKIFEDVLKAEKFCLCGMLAAEVATLNEENRLLLNQYFQQVESWLTSLLQNGSKEILSDIEPTKLAKIIMSGLEGAILIDRIGGGRQRLRAQKELIQSMLR